MDGTNVPRWSPAHPPRAGSHDALEIEPDRTVQRRRAFEQDQDSTYVACAHGWILCDGPSDESITPLCVNSKCTSAALKWWEENKDALSESEQDLHGNVARRQKQSSRRKNDDNADRVCDRG
eukprot:3669391-Prymnesium_polylepis.1